MRQAGFKNCKNTTSQVLKLLQLWIYLQGKYQISEFVIGLPASAWL